eukprot:UN08673
MPALGEMARLKCLPSTKTDQFVWILYANPVQGYVHKQDMHGLRYKHQSNAKQTIDFVLQIQCKDRSTDWACTVCDTNTQSNAKQTMKTDWFMEFCVANSV